MESNERNSLVQMMARERHLLESDAWRFIFLIFMQVDDGSVNHVLDVYKASHVAQIFHKAVLSRPLPYTDKQDDDNNFKVLD